MARVLVLTGHKKQAKAANVVWTGTVTAVLLILSILAFLPFPLGATCDHASINWHWLTIIWIDTISALLMVLMTVAMYTLRQGQEQAVRASMSMQTESTSDDMMMRRPSFTQDRFTK